MATKAPTSTARTLISPMTAKPGTNTVALKMKAIFNKTTGAKLKRPPATKASSRLTLSQKLKTTWSARSWMRQTSRVRSSRKQVTRCRGRKLRKKKAMKKTQCAASKRGERQRAAVLNS